MPRQYVIVKFRESDVRGYTYHNDGPPVAPGEAVKIPDKHGDGWTRRKVHGVTYEKPEGKFDTKEILGLAPAEVPTELDLGKAK